MNSNVILIGFLVVFLLTIGFVSQELGITNPVIVVMDEPESPNTTNFFSALVNVAIVAINMVAGFFQLMTFQVQGIPAMANTFIMVPISFMMGYIVIRIFRGGG